LHRDGGLYEQGDEVSAREMARRIVAVVTLPDAQALALTDVIETTIERAVAVEREACAVICDEEADHPEGDSADAAATRIRERGTK